MREILFRGKRIDNGEWVFGWYEPPVEWDGHKFGTTIAYICEEGYLDDAEVDPSTVGQYTGLTDKNGKRVFEGDVVYDGFTKDKVVFEDCQWKLVDRHGMWINLFNREVEVIGNIHDNPELLEGGTDNE